MQLKGSPDFQKKTEAELGVESDLFRSLDIGLELGTRCEVLDHSHLERKCPGSGWSPEVPASDPEHRSKAWLEAVWGESPNATVGTLGSILAVRARACQPLLLRGLVCRVGMRIRKSPPGPHCVLSAVLPRPLLCGNRFQHTPELGDKGVA